MRKSEMIEPESIEQKLLKMGTTRLTEIVIRALDTMGETEQINFIAKYIDAQESLARLGVDDPEAFLSEVDRFCLACLNEEYYSDEDDIEEYFSSREYDSSYYDEDWDYDEFYSNSEWAEVFTKLLELSTMYIRSGDIATGYEATSRLLSCLIECMSDDRFLGTDDPDDYIDVDWRDVFSVYYSALFEYHTDAEKATEMALRYWMRFGDRCTEGFLNNVKDIPVAERYILDEVWRVTDWTVQKLCFDLLERLYTREGKSFDKALYAKALLDANDFFYLYIVEGYCEQNNWQAAAETAKAALEKIPALPADNAGYRQTSIHKKVRTAIQTKLADAYEALEDYKNAFELLHQMFKEAPDYDLYIRARALADKTAGMPLFLEKVETQLKEEPRYSFPYSQSDLLISIYSYEGEIVKLLYEAQSKKISVNYYARKYIALSLIYRAVDNTGDVGGRLAEYLASALNKNGISDMRKSSINAGDKTILLQKGTDLLKEIAAFHIDAAIRTRYAKAAYYMCVIRDIYMYLGQEDAFGEYFGGVIAENSRRPALRDEMSIVYGRRP